MSRSDEEPPSRRVFFTREFKRNIRQLVRKYRRIKHDIQPLITDVGGTNLPGDRISGIAEEVYKARARNSDSQRGKSGGYRMIYEVTPEGAIILLTVYSKTEQDDISVQEIAAIITKYAEEQAENADDAQSKDADDAQSKDADDT